MLQICEKLQYSILKGSFTEFTVAAFGWRLWLCEKTVLLHSQWALELGDILRQLEDSGAIFNLCDTGNGEITEQNQILMFSRGNIMTSRHISFVKGCKSLFPTIYVYLVL